MVLLCKKYHKLNKKDAADRKIIDNPTNPFSDGCFWIEGDTYEMNGREVDALLSSFPSHFEVVG